MSSKCIPILLLILLLMGLSGCKPSELPGKHTYFVNDHKYVGQLLDGDFHGEGEFTRKDGTRYAGHWEHHQLFRGSVIRTDGFEYEFDGNLFHIHRVLKEGIVVGEGIVHLTNGDRYTGYIDIRGHFFGRGILLHPDGTQEIGLWKDSKLFKEVDFELDKSGILKFDTELKDLAESRIPELDHLLREASILAIQRYFDSGELTSEELVLYYIYRIYHYDVNKLNSVLELNPDALTIARKLDRERENKKQRGNMHGIPVLLKDNIGTGDKLHTTAGAKALADARSDRDAFLVGQLRNAGAIILGKCNLSEWANLLTYPLPSGFSGLGSQTRNPYGRFSTGGSSSGSAVAVAANFATVSIGTETTGSLTSPASQNSIYTLKPSLGLISRDRIIPVSNAMDSAGPMARNVTDLSILLTTLVGVDPSDPVTKDAESLSGIDFSQYLVGDGLEGKRIGIVNYSYYESKEGGQLLEKVVSLFRKTGAEVSLIHLPNPKPRLDFGKMYNYSLKRGVNRYLSNVGDNTSMTNLEEVIAFNEKDSIDRIPFGQSKLKYSQQNSVTPAEYEEMTRKGKNDTQNYIRKLLKDRQVDFLLTLRSRFSTIYAPAGFPALTIPVGYSRSGEPVGLTLVGDYLTDAELIAAAYAFEQKHQLVKPSKLK